MKGQKLLPYAFLVVLFLIAVFILGVKYGKRVEQADKTIKYTLSIPPTQPPVSPTPLKYMTYSSKACGVQFLYPSFLKSTGETSMSATLKQNSSSMIVISCEKTSDIAKMLKDPKIATAEVTLKNRKIQTKKVGDTLYFQTTNPYHGTSINVSITQDLYPLFANTLQFTQ